MTKPTPQPAQRVRVIHSVKAGESLASIALRHYGDARFARLIMTINRGEVATRTDGFSEFAFISPGQNLSLPTYEEANIFSRHFFTQKSHAKFDLSHFARPAMPSDSIPVNILPSQGSRSPNNMVLPSVQSLPAGSRPVEYIEPAQARNESRNQFECQFIARQPSAADAAYISARMAEKIMPQERVYDMAPPPTVSVARLIDQAPAQDRPEVFPLSHYCRMIKFEVEGGQSDTIIKLQVLEETRWQTITAYIITEEKSRRVAHYAEKNSRAVQIDLPSEVAKELSISDLKRNWKEYVQGYFESQARMAGFAGGNDGSMQAAY